MLSSMDSVCLRASFSTELKKNGESKCRTKLLFASLLLLDSTLLCGRGLPRLPLLRIVIHKVQGTVVLDNNQYSIYKGTRSSLSPMETA